MNATERIIDGLAHLPASEQAEVLGLILAKVAQASTSDILTPRSFCLLAYHAADRIITQDRHGGHHA